MSGGVAFLVSKFLEVHRKCLISRGWRGSVQNTCETIWADGRQPFARFDRLLSLPRGRWSIARGGASREAASGTPGRAPKTDRCPERDAIVGGGGEGRAEARPQPPPPTTTAVPGPQVVICRRLPLPGVPAAPEGLLLFFTRPQGIKRGWFWTWGRRETRKVMATLHKIVVN